MLLVREAPYFILLCLQDLEAGRSYDDNLTRAQAMLPPSLTRRFVFFCLNVGHHWIAVLLDVIERVGFTVDSFFRRRDPVCKVIISLTVCFVLQSDFAPDSACYVVQRLSSGQY